MEEKERAFFSSMQNLQLGKKSKCFLTKKDLIINFFHSLCTKSSAGHAWQNKYFAIIATDNSVYKAGIF
jgi:hypothetical protein